MYKFHKDVRIEDHFATTIMFTNGNLDEMKDKNYQGAFIRIYNGKMWYYSSTTDINKIQAKINTLTKLAIKDRADISSYIKNIEVNKGEYFKFKRDDVSKISQKKKLTLLESIFPMLKKEKAIKLWHVFYIDEKIIKKFYSSSGSDLSFDFQKTGISINMNFSENGKNLSEKFATSSNYFSKLKLTGLKKHIEKCKYYMRNAEPVKKGEYKIILSPIAAGVFAHESFGHKSESDFMIGDEKMKKEWTLGKKVGSTCLSIVDQGNIMGIGYVPFDDEGTKAKKTYLIKNGILEGRLHNVYTANHLKEKLTGNGRAVNFQFEPIVRMTNTYIEPGKTTKEELFKKVKDGIFIDTIKHGSGLSTFTIAPSLAYSIKNGKIHKPVNISVITGNVFKTLSLIEDVSNKKEILSFVLGGCGKGEQYPLPVGIGGPFVLVKKLNVQ